MSARTKTLISSNMTRLNAENVRVIGDFFFDRAKEHLQKIEAGGGDITTVQALIIMTIREVSTLPTTSYRNVPSDHSVNILQLGQNRSRSGWAYSGQAIRLALYLNLHSDGAQPSGLVFKEEEKRRVIWECQCSSHFSGQRLVLTP